MEKLLLLLLSLTLTGNREMVTGVKFLVILLKITKET